MVGITAILAIILFAQFISTARDVTGSSKASTKRSLRIDTFDIPVTVSASPTAKPSTTSVKLTF